MEYIYKNSEGERIILDFPIAQAPNKTKVEGVIYERDLEAELRGKSFCLKGGGWPGQDMLRKKQMTENNESAGKRSKDTWGDPKKVIPNYKGEVCESWDEASSLSKKDKE
jgi:hypothetical protein